MTEKRKVSRQRALKAARIVLKGGSSTMDCTVKNLSDIGAKLVGDNFLAVPDDFDVLMDGFEKRHCVVRWRNLKELGIEFV
ncbi:PilZ domain-containing protein [Allorhizobium terrae]|uniref:PilZ domain-containing protein n=1 Tax=Allorhizobium terrae TaxID=1848972 RepID=A0A4V3W7P1_9HYPH|nr:PilZ domain-containing protein [Allorhizobium terrae]THF48024.1 PilZ domain-containing protein [Allorhizobium terrae]TWD48601.1 hypothetical protein FB480_10886 [Agrobacterium vitis]